jgi:hypothetical protein
VGLARAPPRPALRRRELDRPQRRCQREADDDQANEDQRDHDQQEPALEQRAAVGGGWQAIAAQRRQGEAVGVA